MSALGAAEEGGDVVFARDHIQVQQFTGFFENAPGMTSIGAKGGGATHAEGGGVIGIKS